MKIFFISILLLSQFINTNLYSQIDQADDCRNQARAIVRLQPFFYKNKKSDLEKLLENLNTCNDFSPEMHYARAILKMELDPNNLPLEDIDAAIDGGYKKANTLRGIIYLSKVGSRYYSDPQFDLSLNYYMFQASGSFHSESESPIALYGRGYTQMKGVGTNQSYSSAKRFFEQSPLPMAKHWLGVLHYFGYGTPKNIGKAKEIWKNNNIENSNVILSAYNAKPPEEFLITSVEDDILSKASITDFKNFKRFKDRDNIEFKVTILKQDWSKKQYLQRDGFNIKLRLKQSVNDVLFYDYEVSQGSDTEKGIAEVRDDIITFKSLLPITTKEFYPYQKNVNISGLLIHKLKMKEVFLTNPTNGLSSTFLVSDAERGEVLGKETGEKETATTFIFQDSELFRENGNSNNSPIKDSDVTVSPNPFYNSFSVNFDVDEMFTIGAQLLDRFGNPLIIKKNTVVGGTSSRNQIDFDPSQIPDGMYILKIEVNGSYFITRTIIKSSN